MLILYQSNDFNILKHMFLYIIKRDNIIINKNIVLISNNNISLFLKIFLSKYLDVLVNLKFSLVAKFIWNLCKYNFSDISDINYFNRFNLIFIIMKLLPKLINKKEFYILKNYLYKDLNNEKLLNLSINISNIYDKYLVYRFDLLEKWENYILDNNINNIHQIWQSILWRKIINYFSYKFNCNQHRSNILLRFIYLLNNKKDNFKICYKNIFIFNILNIPNIYLNIIYLLSNYIDIHYFLVNPCKEYWYDINILNSFNVLDNKKNIFNNNNLNLMFLYYSKIFGEFLYLLFNYDILDISYYNENFNNNLLNKIKKNILFFKNFKYFNNKLDNSIVIESCFSYFDELYKLRDFLFNLIKKNKYKCNDIIVVVSNIELYFNYINLVFKEYKNDIPYFIMNENINLYNILFNFFIKILNINDINLDSNNFLIFLKNNLILNKFKIDNNELDILLNLIKNVNFLKDINNFYDSYIFSNKNNNILLINNLKSLLLSYAVNTNFFSWKNIISYSIIDNNLFYNIIGKFSHLIFTIIYWKKKLSKNFSLKDWIIICNKIIKDFFNKNDIKKFNFLNNFEYKKLLNCFGLINFKKKVNNKFFIKIIKIFFKKKNIIKQYSINHINFCSFLPLRSIPFKVICILGMNLEYPKNNFNYNFDLMYLYPKLGDRNKFENEKYLFFEYLLSVKDILYISYVNFSIKNFNKFLPSILLDNLINYIYINFNLLFNNKQDFLFIKKLKLNFSKKKLLNNNNNFIIYRKFIKYKYFNLNKLYSFWFYPIKFFFDNSLNIKLFNFNNFNNINYLNFNYKNFYFFRKIFINNLLLGNYFNDNFYLYLEMLNLFPKGNFGKILWIKEKYNIIKLFNNIYNIKFKFKRYIFIFKENNINFRDIIYFNKFINIKWVPKNINLIDGLLFWINHLVYCYLGNFKDSILYGYNCFFIFKKLDINLSKKFLIFYINGFLYGINKPLFFLPKLSNILLLYIYNLKNIDIYNNNNLLYFYINKYKKYLLNNFFIKKELDDIYINILRKNNYFIDINLIINQSIKWLLPILKFLIIKYY